MKWVFIVFTIFIWACSNGDRRATKEESVRTFIDGLDLSEYTKLLTHNQGNIYFKETTKGQFFETGYESQIRVLDIRTDNNVDFIYFDTVVVTPNVYSKILLTRDKVNVTDSLITITYSICPDGEDACDSKEFYIR